MNDSNTTAVVAGLNWAAGVVDRALAAERGALPRRARVQVTGGTFAGQVGTVESPAWRPVPAGDEVEPGGYLVCLDRPDTTDRSGGADPHHRRCAGTPR